MTIWSDRVWGDGDPACEICHGLGHLRYEVPDDHPAFGQIFPCRCQWAKAALKWQKISGITSTDAKWTFDSLNIYEDTLKEAIAEARAFAIHQGGGMLTFLGLYGTAKTHLGCAFVNDALHRGIPAAIVKAEVMLEYIRDGYKNQNDNALVRLQLFAEEARLLVLDELGRIYDTDWATQKLFDILDARYRLALANTHKTVICANVQRDPRGYPIFAWDDGAIASRLMQFPIVEIKQADARPALGRKSYRDARGKH